MFTLMYTFWRFVIIPLIYYLFVGLKDSAEPQDSSVNGTKRTSKHQDSTTTCLLKIWYGPLPAPNTTSSQQLSMEMSTSQEQTLPNHQHFMLTSMPQRKSGFRKKILEWSLSDPPLKNQ